MKMSQGFDCSIPLTAGRCRELKAAGMEFVGRYINGSWKKMNVAELKLILDAGLQVFSIYETTAKMALTSDGFVDGQNARILADELKQPRDTPIYFAVDQEITSKGDFAIIAAYFAKVKLGLAGKYKIGIYGSFKVMTDAYTRKYADYFFQTYAWSDGYIFGNNNIFQYKNGVMIASVEVDKCQGVLEYTGAWVLPTKVTVPVKPPVVKPPAVPVVAAPDFKDIGFQHLVDRGLIDPKLWTKDTKIDMGTLGLLLGKIYDEK